MEIHRKIKRKNTAYIEPATTDQLKEIIDYLLQKNYLNDQEYISLYLEGPAQRKSLGPNRIKAELSRKGLQFDLVKQQLTLNNYQEILHAENFLAKKYPQQNFQTLDQKTRSKIFRQLYSRGFTTSTISQLLNYIER